MKRTFILIVDDMEVNRVILREQFMDSYSIIEAEDGLTAMNLIEEYKEELAIILLDIFLPGADGFSILDWMNKLHYLESLPVILITGDTSLDVEKKGFDMGASDIITKPFNPHITKRRVSNTVSLYQHKNRLESMVASQIEQLSTKNEILKKQSEQLKAHENTLIEAISTIVEFRDFDSGEHIRRIKYFTKTLLLELQKLYPDYGLTASDIELFTKASVLHDIGKVAIPDKILLKPGRLTSEEFEIIKSHTTIGCDILEDIHTTSDIEFFQCSYDICRHHHEKWDGKGYPDRLAGDEIPISAQVVSVADVYDALTHKRIYKDAYSHNSAIKMIYQGECGAFSPKLLHCLKEASPKFQKLCSQSQTGA